jgi:hypothetical protein
MKILVSVLTEMTLAFLAESCQGDRKAEGEPKDLLLVKKDVIFDCFIFSISVYTSVY